MTRRATIIGWCGFTAMSSLIVASMFVPEIDSVPIPCRGGVPLNIVAATKPIYRQTDPRWRMKRVGNTGEGFGASGCTVCSVSMALADCGIDLPPDLLNERLKKADGFTREGFVRWDVLEDLIIGRATLHLPLNPTFDVIDESLAAGHGVIARIQHRDGLPHWVMISGKAGLEYLIRDPLGRADGLGILSAYHSPIFAIRIILPDG